MSTTSDQPTGETGAIRLLRLLLPALSLYALGFAVLHPEPLAVVREYAAFLFLGVTGAIFANSTGAGGGVVFIPAFGKLGFSELQAVATSFGIQCYGMTAGAITWSLFYRRQRLAEPAWQAFLPIIALCSILSIAGLWTAYGLGIEPPTAVKPLFGGFSLLLGVAVLLTAALYGAVASHQLEKNDLLALGLIAYGGGLVTAWLSVGVGEFVAFYLILRRFDVTLSVAAAVVISAITVWAALPQHTLRNPSIYWEVVLFAGPGAVVGGIIARRLVLWLGARRLKFFFGFWLLVIGATELAVAG